MRLGCPFGNPEGVGDLSVTESLHVKEDEDRPGTRRKPEHRGVEIKARPSLGAECSGAVEQRHIGEIGRDRYPDAAAAPLTRAIEHRVDRDPMEPGGETALASVAPQAFPDADEDVLNQLCCQHRVGADAKAERKNPPDVLVVERRECEVIPALGGQDGRIDRNLENAGRKRNRCNGVEHPSQTPPGGNEFTLLRPPCGGPVIRSGTVSVFDELEQKARELAAEAKAALENPEEFLDKTRERVKEAVCDAKEDLAEFATDAQKEFDQIREKVADLFDCEPKPSETAAGASEPAPAGSAAGEAPPAASAEPA